jgi:hypothetical protein
LGFIAIVNFTQFISLGTLVLNTDNETYTFSKLFEKMEGKFSDFKGFTISKEETMIGNKKSTYNYLMLFKLMNGYEITINKFKRENLFKKLLNKIIKSTVDDDINKIIKLITSRTAIKFLN